MNFISFRSKLRGIEPQGIKMVTVNMSTALVKYAGWLFRRPVFRPCGHIGMQFIKPD